MRRFIEADDLQILVRLDVSIGPVDGNSFAPLVAQEHVLADGHIGDQRELLVDDDNAFRFAVTNLGKAALLAIINDVAGIGTVGIDAAEDIH